MIFDRKKSVTAILSKVGKDGRSSESEVKQESGDHDEYTSLAEDILAHVKAGSVQGLASCLKEFHELIEGAED